MYGRYFPMQIQGGMRPEKGIPFPETRSHVLVNNLVWVLGMKTGSSARAQSAFISKTISNPKGVVSKANL